MKLSTKFSPKYVMALFWQNDIYFQIKQFLSNHYALFSIIDFQKNTI